MSQTYVPAELRRLVRERAGECCEYCLIPETVTFAAHELDQIVAEKHGGPTTLDNLALACALCNGFKGSDLASIDSESGAVVSLFNPRREAWSVHFRLIAGRIEALSPVGRVTVRLLQLNHPDRVQERQLLVQSGVVRSPAEKAAK